MADKKPEPPRPEEESKKDTVRINLPPAITGRPESAQDIAKTTVPMSPIPTDEESKKETAVMGKPAATPKPKSDTSRVQVPGGQPATPEIPRPTVKLRRETEPGAAAAPGPAVAPAQPVVVAGGPSGADVGLAVIAMLLSLGVAGYLASIAMG
jgi:hypothetical protein